MKTQVALAKLLKRYNSWSAQAAESGNVELAKQYARLRDRLSGIIGSRERERNRKIDATLTKGAAGPRPTDS